MAGAGYIVESRPSTAGRFGKSKQASVYPRTDRVTVGLHWLGTSHLDLV